MSLVSLIIPAYNSAKYLRDSLASALNQNDQSFFEIIVVDDGSSDFPEKVTEEFGSRVRLIKHEGNKGLSAARNTGATAASGDFIAFLDADDVLSPNYLKTMLAFLSIHSLQCGGCWLYYMSELGARGRTIKTFPLISQNADFPGTFPSGFIIEKNLFDKLGGYSLVLKMAEDTELVWRVFALGYPVFNLPEELVGYRINASSMTSTGKEKKMFFMDLLYLKYKCRIEIPVEKFEEIYASRTQRTPYNLEWSHDKRFQNVYNKSYPWKQLVSLRAMYALWLDRKFVKLFFKAIYLTVNNPAYLRQLFEKVM